MVTLAELLNDYRAIGTQLSQTNRNYVIMLESQDALIKTQQDTIKSLKYELEKLSGANKRTSNSTTEDISSSQ